MRDAERAVDEAPKTAEEATPHRADPRRYQILVLAALAAYGALALDLEIRALVVATILASALGTQWLFCRWIGLRFDPMSPSISALSLALLLRTTSPAIALLTAFLAIGSKFVLRRGDRHLFNPSALGLVAAVLLTDAAWVSPGQWGSVSFLALLIGGLGILVVHHAARSDVSLAFLGAWAAIVLGRALWLGDPLTIPAHQLQSGALLIFAFHMISDPRTAPDSRAGRIVFACLVAAGAGLIQFGLYRANGPLYALVAFSLFVPLIDRWLPVQRHDSRRAWRPTRRPPRFSSEPRPSVLASLALTPRPARADERNL